jgi:hypothetical protein
VNEFGKNNIKERFQDLFASTTIEIDKLEVPILARGSMKEES